MVIVRVKGHAAVHSTRGGNGCKGDLIALLIIHRYWRQNPVQHVEVVVVRIKHDGARLASVGKSAGDRDLIALLIVDDGSRRAGTSQRVQMVVVRVKRDPGATGESGSSGNLIALFIVGGYDIGIYDIKLMVISIKRDRAGATQIRKGAGGCELMAVSS